MQSELLSGAIASVIVLICIFLHYEVMSWCSRWMARPQRPQRWRIAIIVATLVLAHVVEVWIFGLTYWFECNWEPLGGALMPSAPGLGSEPITQLLDCVYFSVTSFTTLGFGDIVPMGPLRVLTGAEALTGLSLVTWSASFTFLEMQRHWREGEGLLGESRP